MKHLTLIPINEPNLLLKISDMCNFFIYKYLEF